MSNISDANEVELERQALLKQFDDADLNERGHYDPGSMGCHELLDRTSLIMQMLEEYVVEHPACIRKPVWFALASEASANLNRLYQEIGAEHIGR